jgi:hypothetical protein
MIACSLAIIIYGCIDVGGFEEVIHVLFAWLTGNMVKMSRQSNKTKHSLQYVMPIPLRQSIK